MEAHKSDLFQYHSRVHGLHRSRAPYKWTMALDKHGGNSIRIFFLESLLDHQAGFFFILAFDLSLCHFLSARNLTIKIIAMRCTKGEDAATSLRKACCPTAVSVYDSTNVGKRFIELKMRGGIRGRF